MQALRLVRGRAPPGRRPASVAATSPAAAAQQYLHQQLCHQQQHQVRRVTHCAKLEGRGVIEVKGGDAAKLLQGLVTSDVGRLAAPSSCQPTAFLNTKGRVVGDGLLARGSEADTYLLDCPLPVVPQLTRHMKIYKLRSKASVADRTASLAVVVAGATLPQGPPANLSSVVHKLQSLEGAVAAFADPRYPGMGARAIISKDAPWQGLSCCNGVSETEFDTIRLSHGVAEGAELGDRTPLECNLELLHYIAFTKGCYLGQELTARTHFKGVVRKRLLPVIVAPVEQLAAAAAPLPSASALLPDSIGFGNATPAGVQEGAEVLCRAAGAEAAKVGQIVSVGKHGVCLAMLRLDQVLAAHRGAAMTFEIAGSDALRVLPYTPAWWPDTMDVATGKVPV